MNAQGTPTKEKIPGGDYSLKTHTTSLFKIHWRVKDWRLKWILWEEYWKSSILKISISFLTMIWLIFLELNDVFKPSTYPKGLNHKPTTLSNFDLLDKNENAFNGESSSVLGCFEIVEQPHRQGSDECCYQIPSLDFDYSLCLTSVLDQLLY